MSTFIKIIFICCTLLFSATSFSAAPVFILNLDNANINSSFVKKIDLTQTIVNMTAKKNNPVALNNALSLLIKATSTVPVLAGFSIDVPYTLDKTTAKYINILAAKSVFVTTQFSYKTPILWEKLFLAEKRNPNLFLTTYGERASAQIHIMSALAKPFLQSGILLTHFYINGPLITPHTWRFWNIVSLQSLAEKQPLGVFFISKHPQPATKTPHLFINLILGESKGYLFWLGGENLDAFTPGTLNANTLSVWRYTSPAVKAWVYDRKDPPFYFYLALGLNEPAFQFIKSISQRAKNIVTILANQNPTFLSMANTLILSPSQIQLPPNTSLLKNVKLTILINEPSTITLWGFLKKYYYLRTLISNTKEIELLDYSRHYNRLLYFILSHLLETQSTNSFVYNTNNIQSLRDFLWIANRAKIQQVVLGPEAMQLTHEART